MREVVKQRDVATVVVKSQYIGLVVRRYFRVGWMDCDSIEGAQVRLDIGFGALVGGIVGKRSGARCTSLGWRHYCLARAHNWIARIRSNTLRCGWEYSASAGAQRQRGGTRESQQCQKRLSAFREELFLIPISRVNMLFVCLLVF